MCLLISRPKSVTTDKKSLSRFLKGLEDQSIRHVHGQEKASCGANTSLK